MKSICLLSRRPGSTREAFRDYYENRHSRLGAKHFPFRKYVRNHVLEASVPIDFDVITEFWFDDDFTGPGALMAGRIGVIMSLDERNFMNQSLIRPAADTESLLAGPVRDVAAAGTHRQILMVSPAPGREAGFEEAVRRWGLLLAAERGVCRVSLDRIQSAWAGGMSRFPAAALLSLWLAEAAPAISVQAPADIALSASVLMAVFETPPEVLRALYAPD
jgi:hypothetical protein